MSQAFVRVPPQSTGKRVLTTERYSLQFDNQLSEFNVKDVVVGASSGASGTITAIDTDGYSVNSGLLWLKDTVGTFVNDESIQVSAATIATSNITGAVPYQDYDIQNVVISDPQNPSYKQRIDRFGATINTFTDGSPTFGAFGTLTVGEPQLIKEYRFAYDGLNSQFYDNVSGVGSEVTYETLSSAILVGVSTTSGAIAQRTSNFYHPYAPGVGHSVEMTMRHGDVGKANNRRRWGYFDDNNGVFFELDGTSLYVVVRSNVSGSVVDTRIPQAEWSNDRLDGSDNIGFTLDITNPNIYFIDLQWLGTGRIRFGVIEPGGSKIIAHVVENANQPGDYPYMRTASLPIRIENENTGSAGSGSEMRFVCSAVKHASKSIIAGDRHTYGTQGLVTVAAADGEVPVLSLRPKTTFNGLPNHAFIKFLAVQLGNVTNTGGGPVLIRIRQAGSASVLTGASFVSHSADSIAEEDVSATAVNTALTNETLQFLILADQTEYIQVPDTRELHALELYMNADETTQPLFIVTAECLSGTSADVYVSTNAEEVKL